jgi:hypothetical protein
MLSEFQIHMFLKTFNERYLGTPFLLFCKLAPQNSYIFDKVFYKMDRNYIELNPIKGYNHKAKTIFHIPSYGNSWQIFYLI